MQRYLINCLLCISLSCLLGACAVPSALTPLPKGQSVVLDEQQFKPVFKHTFKAILFKTSLAYGDKLQMSGLLVLKQLKPNNYRTVFMTQFGLTLFDFEFGEQGFIIHKALEQLNRPIFLKLIQQDMELLLSRNIIGQTAQLYKKSKETQVLKVVESGTPLFFVQEKEQRLKSVYKGKKISIQYDKYRLGLPRKVNIQHHGLPLKLDLTLLKH